MWIGGLDNRVRCDQSPANPDNGSIAKPVSKHRNATILEKPAGEGKGDSGLRGQPRPLRSINKMTDPLIG